ELLDALEAEACADELSGRRREDERLRTTTRGVLLARGIVLDVAPADLRVVLARVAACNRGRCLRDLAHRKGREIESAVTRVAGLRLLLLTEDAEDLRRRLFETGVVRARVRRISELREDEARNRIGRSLGITQLL